MEHILPTIMVLVLGLIALRLLLQRAPAPLRPFLGAAFVAHVLSAFAQIAISQGIYGGGDMSNYLMWGTDVVRALQSRSNVAFEESINLLLQRPSGFDYLPVPQSSSGSMIALIGFLLYALGESMYAVGLALSIAAFFGSAALYFGLRRSLTTPRSPWLEYAALLTPSVVFWSSGILKETVAMAALGPLVLGSSLVLTRRYFVGALMMVASGFVVGLFKPYILFAFGIAFGAWAYAHRAQLKSGGSPLVLKPMYFVVGGALAVGSVALFGRVFPEFGAEHLVENVSRFQTLGEQVGGGSFYGGATPDGTGSGQAAYAPIALLTALFRPLIFEARNPQMFMSALESTVLLVLFVRALRRPADAFSVVRSEPVLLFGLAFTLAFGAAVGLATTNFGTLVRYRIPLMPFWVLVVFSMSSAASQPAAQRLTAFRRAR